MTRGETVGMEYYEKGTNRALQHGEGWIYWIVFDNSEETEIFQESSIKPLNPFELNTLIQAEIKSHEERVAVLTEQLELQTQGSDNGKP